MTSANLTQAECVARAATVTPQSYLVELDLTTAPDCSQARFTSRTTVHFDGMPGADTWIDLLAGSVTKASLNGTEIDVEAYDGARLPIAGLAERNTLVVTAECSYSRSGEGLHRFTDPLDDLTYLYSHFEPTDARRMFACFEQPDLKARFTFKITAPADWVVRSGQPEVERDEFIHADGKHCATVTFAPTPPLSTYVTSVAAGPYHQVSDEWHTTRADGTTQTVPITLLCRQTMVDHLEAEDIFEVVKQGLTYFDDKFQFPYPWGKYDQIYVPEYNLGAMENPGLVTFSEIYLPRGGVTAQQRTRRASVTMHEMAHMWFGDLATMRWWDGLWLKESFADFMGYYVAHQVTRHRTSMITFAVNRKASAYHDDQLSTTHPIAATIHDLEAARQNFDGITYAKGAAVIKQLMTYVGTDAFFAGARAYFAEYAYASTELRDLLECLTAASGRDLDEWSTKWLLTSGVVTLTPQVERDGQRITRLVVAQEGNDFHTGEPLDLPHRLRIGLYRVIGGRLERTRVIDADVTGPTTEIAAARGESADLILVNEDDLTYAKVRLDEHSLHTAAAHLCTIDLPLSRALIWSSVYNATRDAELTPTFLLDLVATQVARETEPVLVNTMWTQAVSTLRNFVPEAQREQACADLIRVADSALRQAPPGSDRQRAWALALAELAGDHTAGVDIVRRLLRDPLDGLTIDDDLRWTFWKALAAQGSASNEELAAQLQRDPSMSGRSACAEAKASRPDPEVKYQAWTRITTGTDLTNDELRSLTRGFAARSGSDLTQPYAPNYYQELLNWWGSRSQTMATIMASNLFPSAPLASGELPEDNPASVAARAWLADHGDAPAALRRIITEQHDDLLRALQAQQAAGLTTA